MNIDGGDDVNCGIFFSLNTGLVLGVCVTLVSLLKTHSASSLSHLLMFIGGYCSAQPDAAAASQILYMCLSVAASDPWASAEFFQRRRGDESLLW